MKANDVSLNQARENYAIMGAISEVRTDSSRKPYKRELPENNKGQKRYECMCCGNFTYPEPDLIYYTCPVCYWEKDYLKPEHYNYYSGEGAIPSLDQAKESYKIHGAFSPHAVAFVRRPFPEELPENNR